MTAWTNYRGQARGLRGRGCRRAAGQSVQQAPGAPARSSHRTGAAGSSYHVQRHLLGTRTARDARLFGPARRRPARFLGQRRAAKRHKIRRAGDCRRASAGHGNYAGHSRLKRPPMASLAATTSCAKFGRNDTIPLRGSWCKVHTYLTLACQVGAARPHPGLWDSYYIRKRLVYPTDIASTRRRGYRLAAYRIITVG